MPSCHANINLLVPVAVDLAYWDEWCERGEGDVFSGRVGDSPGEMSRGQPWRFLSPSKTIHGTSCCCESHYNTKDPTEDLFTRVQSRRAQAIHTHVTALVKPASDAVIVKIISHLQFVYSNNKVIWARFEDLSNDIWKYFLCCEQTAHPHKLLTKHSLTVCLITAHMASTAKYIIYIHFWVGIKCKSTL